MELLKNGLPRITGLFITEVILLSFYLSQHANAFPQALRRSIASYSQRCVSAHGPSSTHLFSNANGVEDDGLTKQANRREILQRSIQSLGLALASISSHPSTANAIGFDLSNLLLSADGENRGVKGMAAPTKKTSGLGYKIRSVSKVMVS